MRAATVAVMAGILWLGACGDDDDSSTDTTDTTEAGDGATVLAKGEDVELVGSEDLAGQTLDIDAVQDGDDVSGEIRFTDTSGHVVVSVECADTDTDGVVVLGGTVTEPADDPEIYGLIAMFIKEGEPDSVAIWTDLGENPSCEDLLSRRHDVLDDESAFVDVEDGSDIETG